jgi:hypothetical protein
MAEKSFRQIEAEITDRGFSALCGDAAYEIQNVTRLLGYLEDELREDYPDMAMKVFEATGQLIRAGITLVNLSKNLDAYGK